MPPDKGGIFVQLSEPKWCLVMAQENRVKSGNMPHVRISSSEESVVLFHPNE